jgi:large subunit ribosomal protein L30
MSKQKAQNVKMLKLRQIRSGIGSPQKLKVVLRGLGFGKLQRIIERPDTDSIRGMVAKVSHLVEIVE